MTSALNRRTGCQRRKKAAPRNHIARLEALEPRLALSGGLMSQWASLGLGRAATRPPAVVVQTVKLNPNADAGVLSGAYADTNFGNGLLLVTQDSNPNDFCQSYVRFDMSSVSGTVTRAVLNLVPLRTTGRLTTLRLYVHLVPDAGDGWVEGTGGTSLDPNGPLTWNNRPQATGIIATIAGSQLKAGRAFALDVTSLVNQGFNANRTATFQIDASTAQGVAYGDVTFASREYGNGCQPVLTVTSSVPANQAPTVAVGAVATPSPVTVADEAARIQGAEFLAQGTLYPDVIESGGCPDGPAATIKLHHNVGGLPEDLAFTLIEPLRDLFKDEVRALGQRLGLPEDIVWRHPFPGPGLAVRCLGEVSRERLDTLRQADAIVVREIKQAGLYRETSQVFAVLLPVQSVGVMGDARTYADVVAVRSINTEDFMTADWSRLPYDLLARISTRIINEVPGVNRVVYDISSKPPATIEWE